jgi:serine/threonine protein kinase
LPSSPRCGGSTKTGTKCWRLAGFRSLSEVRDAFPGGVDPRDAAWMWRRLLVAVGAAHRTGLIHGAVLPEHVMIHPGEHGLVLVDWCYSGPAPAVRVRTVVKRYLDWYPPEVLAGDPAGPDLDIWLATRCMTELVGPRIPARMAAFSRGCLLARPSRRPADAWLWQERLTAMLLRARPVYEDPGPDWPGLVEGALGAPVVLTSYGPTAADKRAVASALRRRTPATR